MATIELVTALVLFTNAVIYALPPDTFSLSINYRLMASIAPEHVWAAAFGLVFAVWAYAHARKIMRLRRVMTTIVGLCLFWMGASFFLSNVQTTIGYMPIILGAGGLAERVRMR